MSPTHKSKLQSFTKLLSSDTIELLSASGEKLIRQVGMDVVRGVVYGILSGKNLRDSTEIITRRRIATLNLAILNMFLKGSETSSDFIQNLPHITSDILQRKKIAKSERWVTQWMLGLTDKAFQNVLRDDPKALTEYRNRYIETCIEVIEQVKNEHGVLSGAVELDTGLKTDINWLFLTYLLNAVGAETLSIRGSEKSSYGKLFEKLVLGSLLHILGFKFSSDYQSKKFNRIFLLASRGKRRECDATLFYELGKAVRFDIGFIGRGNPEISLDKVTRFEREISLDDSKWYTATIIIVSSCCGNG